MTFAFRTMAALEADIVYRFSIGGVTLRHSLGSTGRVRQVFNSAWRRVREIVALAADGAYLQATAIAALPTVAAVTGDVYAEIDFPVDAVDVYGVRCNVNGTRWYPLKRMPFAALHDYQYEGLFQGYAPNRGPVAYTTRTIQDGVGTIETPGKIMVVPIPTSGNYRLWYLQAFADRLNDTDTFPGHAEFYEWAVLQTCITMLSPDTDSQRVYQMWDRERQRAEDMITARACRFEDGIPLEPRDGRQDGMDPDVWRGPL